MGASALPLMLQEAADAHAFHSACMRAVQQPGGSCRAPFADLLLDRLLSSLALRSRPFGHFPRYSWNQAQLERRRGDKPGLAGPGLQSLLSVLPTAALAVAAVACMGDTRAANDK